MKQRTKARTPRAASPARDPHAGPVPKSAWLADAKAREKGRVEIFNATRPGGLDGWTMDLRQYSAMRELILELIDAASDGTVLVKDLVAAAQSLYGGGQSQLFPKGNTRNYCTYTKVDLEARCEIERAPGKSPQKVMRWRK